MAKFLQLLVLFALTVLLMRRASAREFRVGDANGWTVPSDSNITYNLWAERHRFQVGDSLLFVYPSERDSVLHVNKESYDTCNTATPLDVFNDGNTSFKFNKSGVYYFISGKIDNCQKNEKMIVIVMADRRNRSGTETNSTSFASPPPSGSIEIIPAPAPLGQESPLPPPPSLSAASSLLFSFFIGVVGSFFASSLFLAC